MHIGELWRNEIKALLPCGFVKISREGAFLFVSDYPKRTDDTEKVHAALEKAGFLVTLEKGMAYLDAAPEKYRQAWEEMKPLPLPVMTEENARLFYAARLLTEKAVSFDQQPLQLIRHVLRCTMLHDREGLGRLPGMIALQKRNKQPLSPMAGNILLQYLWGK